MNETTARAERLPIKDRKIPTLYAIYYETGPLHTDREIIYLQKNKANVVSYAYKMAENRRRGNFRIITIPGDDEKTKPKTIYDEFYDIRQAALDIISSRQNQTLTIVEWLKLARTIAKSMDRKTVDFLTQSDIESVRVQQDALEWHEEIDGILPVKETRNYG